MIGITGYTGFVGRVLLEQFNPSNVVLLGRTELKGYSNFIQFDLTKTESLKISSGLGKVDTVIHIAARAHVMNEHVNDSLAEYRAVNTEGTIRLAKQAAKSGVRRFIFLSSIKVNGESTTNRAPFSVFDKPNPQDPYGVSKLEAEQELQALGETSGMEIVIIRSPLVYGQGVKANFASLMRLTRINVPLPFRALRYNPRSLVSVYNLVDLIKLCVRHPKAANQILLVSDDYDLSTAEIVALMAKVQNKSNYSFPVPILCFRLIGKLLNKDDVIDRLTGSLQIDITHTKSTLSWTPPYTVEHGFKLAIKELGNN